MRHFVNKGIPLVAHTGVRVSTTGRTWKNNRRVTELQRIPNVTEWKSERRK